MCVFQCGRRGPERDHVEGRIGDDYVSPNLWLPTCPDCNKANWHGWVALGLNRDDGDAWLVRLRRLEYHFGRLGDLDYPIQLAPTFFAALAQVVDELSAAWRERK